MTQPPTVAKVIATQVKRLRRDRGWSAAALAERCAARGHPEITRDRIATLETRRYRALTTAELMIIAVALDVSPVHLMAPLEDDQQVAVTNEITATASQLRAWIRHQEGGWTPPGTDLRRFDSQVPATEYGRATDTLTVKKEA